MNQRLLVKLSTLIILMLSAATGELFAATPTALSSRGYSVLPSPREVELGDSEVTIDHSWSLVCYAGENHIALTRLLDGAKQLHGLSFSVDGRRKIILRIQPGMVKTGASAAVTEQAYRIDISRDSVAITGNTGQGLFYGVQTFLCLNSDCPVYFSGGGIRTHDFQLMKLAS